MAAFTIHGGNDGPSKFKKASDGIHAAVCVAVLNAGKYDNTFDEDKPPRNKVRIIFQILDPEDEGRRKNVSALYTMSLHEKGNLLGKCSSWWDNLGEDFELEATDPGWVAKLHNLLEGRNAIPTLKQSDDGRYVNITSIMPEMPGQNYPLADPDDGYIAWALKDAEGRGSQNEHLNHFRGEAVPDGEAEEGLGL